MAACRCPTMADGRKGREMTKTAQAIRGAACGAILAVTLAGCGSLGSATPAAAGSSGPPVPVAATSESLCLTHACIASDLDKSLVGALAKDESVITKAVCKVSTVKHNAGDTYTARCTVTYSDGNVVTGFGNLLVAQDKVTFEPDGL
jgi:hypothetical protein